MRRTFCTCAALSASGGILASLVNDLWSLAGAIAIIGFGLGLFRVRSISIASQSFSVTSYILIYFFLIFYAINENFVPRYNLISRKTGNGSRFRPCWYSFGISHFTSVMEEILRRMRELFLISSHIEVSRVFSYFENMRVLILTLRRLGRQACRSSLFQGAPRENLQVISKRQKILSLKFNF